MMQQPLPALQRVTTILLAIIALNRTTACGAPIASDGWNVWVNVSPSPSFVDAAKRHLSMYYHQSPAPEHTSPIMADDYNDNGFHVVPTSSGCENENCVAIDHFVFGGNNPEVAQEWILNFLEGVDQPFFNQGPYVESPIYWKPISGDYAILLGDLRSVSLSSPIWSVSVVAAPEPATCVLSFLPLCLLVLRRRRF